MKVQYLGDSKDSFKWDYHDYLASRLGFPVLNIALMMTPDDGTAHGHSRPDLFPARPEVIGFCEHLREHRDIGAISGLPARTGAVYRVALHGGDTHITAGNRRSYFTGIDNGFRQLLFLDPDNGFAPEKSCTGKHVLYDEVDLALAQLSHDSVVSVFQHFRRRRFSEDFAVIRKGLQDCHTTAIYWHSLMFVIAGRSRKTISEVADANRSYAADRPVTVIN